MSMLSQLLKMTEYSKSVLFSQFEIFFEALMVIKNSPQQLYCRLLVTLKF